MRQGELRALSWSSIDFDNQIIKVQAAVKHGTSNIGAPKTKRGRRSIPVDAKTIKALKVLKLQSKYSKDNDLVFPSSNGTPKLQKVLDKLLTRVCKRAGVDKILWGDMRHFYASVQLSSLGEDWSTVAALMGHSTPNFTYKQYGHYVSNDEKQDKSRTAAASAIYGGY
jgi:integrase